jgi:hypothetical protein
MNMKKAAMLICGVASFLFISLMILLLAMPSESAKPDPVKTEVKEKFNKTQYKMLEKKIIQDHKGAIIKIERKGKLFDITLHNQWHNLSKGEKVAVADSIYKKIRNISVASDLIKMGGAFDILLIDQAGNELAERGPFNNEWDFNK